MKTSLKALAAKIRLQKSQRCRDNNGFVFGLSQDQWLYRHMHIVYCLRRGRTMEQIESKVRLGNEPSKTLLAKIAEQHPEVSRETPLHSGAA